MDSTLLKDELLKLERRYWQAIQEKDLETIKNLTFDSCLVSGPHGASSMSREKLLDMFRESILDEDYALNDFTIRDEDVFVQELGEGIAVLAYRVSESLKVDGKPVSLDAADSSVWVKRGEQWLCAAHSEAILGDPYGRDKQPVSTAAA